MVDHMTAVISTYEQRLLNNGFAPTPSFRRAVLGEGGTANRLFVTYLFLQELHFNIHLMEEIRK
jgi:hypothetical protein